MTSFSRRSFFAASGAAAGALTLPSLITPAAAQNASGMTDAPAAKAMMGPEAGYKRFMLGDFEITVLSDGHRTVPNPQSIFGTDQDKATVEDLLAENFLPEDAMQFTFAPVLIKTGSELVLVDTGNGPGAREGGAGQTPASLKAAGYAPEDVTIVVITHMHGDHIGGLMEGDSPTYPNARYVTGQTEYDWWTDDARMGTPAEGNHQLVKKLVVPLADKFTFIGGGDEVTSGITGIDAFGHTPGHMVFRVESGDRALMLTADTANHFVLSLQRPEWLVSFDVESDAATETRKSVFDMIAEEKLPFIGYHMPFPSVGYVKKRDGGYHFVAETYQFAV